MARGLSNLETTADALPAYIAPKNVELFTSHGIFTENEMRARHSIHLESYNKIMAIEARTMVDMAMHQILPAAMKYTHSLCEGVAAKKALGVASNAEAQLIRNLSTSTDALYDHVEKLHNCLAAVPKAAPEAASKYYRNVIVPAMEAVRVEADLLEALTDKSYWPYPTYSDLLFY